MFPVDLSILWRSSFPLLPILLSACGYTLGVRSGGIADPRHCLHLVEVGRSDQTAAVDMEIRSAYASEVPLYSSGCSQENTLQVRVTDFSTSRQVLSYDKNLIPSTIRYTLVTHWTVGAIVFLPFTTTVAELGTYSTNAVFAEQADLATWRNLVGASGRALRSWVETREAYANPAS